MLCCCKQEINKMIFEEFFTLPLFKEDAKGKKYVFWQVDQKSQKYISSIVSQKPDICKAELVKILLQNLLNAPEDELNKRVWISYLSKFSYKAAFEIVTHLKKITTIIPLDSDSAFHDLLQIALINVLSPEKCLETLLKYSEYQNLDLDIWYKKFEKYLSKRVKGLLCDNLREIEGLRTFQRSELGLAARVTKTRVITVLKRLGFNDTLILHYILAWQCFKEAKDAGVIDIISPQPKAFEDICSRYHQFSSQLPQLFSNRQTIDGTVIQQWLQEIGRAIRNYIDFTQVSFDEPISQDSETLTWLDLIPDENSIIQSNDISRHDIVEFVNQLRELTYNKINSLKPEEQRISLFIHGLNLSQEKIGIEIGCNQSTIGRRYKKMLLQLLDQIGTWANEHLQIDINSEKLNELKTYLQEYLDMFYHSLMYKFLANAIQNLESQARKIMHLFWLQQMKTEEIAELVNLTVLEVDNQLFFSKESLKVHVLKQIEFKINMYLKTKGVVCNQVESLLDEWLKIASFTDQKSQ